MNHDLVPRSGVDASTVINLGARRPLVHYTVRLTQDYEGYLSVLVDDVQDDPRSRQAVADALKRAAEMIEGDLKMRC